jgi:uncharacterized glyoxalase superfamily protein PhnB
VAFTAAEALRAGKQIGIDWTRAQFELEQFRAGMDVELEHGRRDPTTDVTGDDVTATAKIALAHLNEFPDYYRRLERMERAAEAGMPYQQVQPYLLYEDAAAAVEWLGRALGATVLERQERDGRLAHAEIEIEGASILLGSPPSGYESPKRRGGPTALVYLYVEHLDASFERATAAGAETLEEPNDQPYGDRRCGIVDLEGHWWYLAQRLAP